jgi:hypothetical protein
MIRALLLSSLVLASGCAASLKAVDRGEWVLVAAEDGKGQEIITQDSYDAEVVAGRDRKVKIAVDEKPTVLHDAPEKLTAVVGQILRFRVNEGGEAELMSDEAVAEVFWTEAQRVDGWKGDQATEGRESAVFVRARKAGKGKLKISDKTWGTKEFELTVSPAK